MGLPDVRKFPFIEPPPVESLEESIMVLKAQNALNDDETLTVIGQMLSNLPVDVSIGKMLIMGTLFNQIEAVLSLAAAISVQTPFTNDAYKDQDCIAARRQLDSDHGDPITLLNSYREWMEVKASHRENSRKWCRKRGLEEQRFYEMTKLRQQFKDLLADAGLLKKDMKNMSSADRTKRHGELKTLREMKKEYHKQEAPNSRQKKMLKMKMFDDAGDDEGQDDKLDIRDIEFRMRNDRGKVFENSKAVTYKDLIILKVILASGLYPQLATGDEFNSDKSGVEQLFHTRVKPFNVLHPNGIFTAYPEYINLDPMYIIHVPGFPAKYPVSAKHQALLYLSLLETNKPYLINTMRMPALHTFLLFSKTIDTNINISRIIFDSWIEVRFPTMIDGQKVLLRATKLREMWESLLTSKLADEEISAEEVDIMENRLAKGLFEFMHTESLYSLKRLLPGDLKIAFVGPGCGQSFDIDDNPFQTVKAIEVNDAKGGYRLTDYLTFNCLENTAEELSARLQEFECELCTEKIYGSAIQISSHLSKCLSDREASEEAETENEKRKDNPNNVAHDCKNCGKILYLTPTEILRHIKNHE